MTKKTLDKVLSKSTIRNYSLKENCGSALLILTLKSKKYLMLFWQRKDVDGVTKEQKEQNQVEWLGKITNFQARTRELILDELIYK